MMSPANASSSSSRRCDRKLTTVFGRSSLPERTTFSRMPRSKWPDATRTNAIRSRCAGSMLAWILKTTPDELRLVGRDLALDRGARARRRRQVDERVEHLADAEVVDRRAEEHRRLLAGEELRAVERRRRVGQQLDLAGGLLVLHAEALGIGRVVEAGEDLVGIAVAVLAALEDAHLLLAQVHHAVEVLAHADRPGERHDLHAELALDLVHQDERLLHFAVHLVDEGQDRRVAGAADLQQAARLRLDAVGRVDHHQRGVDGGQHAVGVFGEVLVAGRVEQVDDAVAVFHLHHRRCDRDAALLLDLHPVGGRMARRPCAPSPSRRSGSRRRTAAASRSAWSCRRRGAK